MKESTEITRASNCSWQLNAMKSVFNKASSDEAKIISLELFKQLPADALLHISSYLPSRYNPRAQKDLAYKEKMFLVSYDKNVDPAFKKLLQEDNLLDKFPYLIAIEGEDNQNQAEAILKQLLQEENYALMSKLISSQKRITDAAGRCFKSISALGYTFWAGDTRMSRMLEAYINILEEKGYETKQTLYDECKHIDEAQGIEFTFNEEHIENSKHFDWQPLIMAYNAYIAAVTPLMNANYWLGDLNDEAWAQVNILWLNIGKELAKVPTHVAQEYCSDIPFSPLPNYRAALNRLTLKRTIQFYNWLSDKTDKIESWFIRGSANLNLGVLFSIFKGPWLAAGMFDRMVRALYWTARCTDDLAAITALREMRTVNDRKQTLENLKPLAPRSNFHP